MTDATDPVARIEHSVLALLRRANDPRGNQRINELAGVDIERAGAVMLSRIEELQPARLSLLAEAAGLDVSTASRQVARLVEQGYVERTSDPTDARAVLHRLSPAGAALRRRLRRAVRTFFDDALQGFSDDERDVLARLLERLVDGVLRSSA